MKKIIAFSGLLSVGLILGSGLGMANTITLSGTGNTAGQTVTGSTGSFTLNAGGTLTVGSGTAAVSLNGSNPSTITVTNNGIINQTGTANAIVDLGGHMTITINNGSSTNSLATLETTNGDTIHMDHATNNVTLNNYGAITSTNTSAGGNQAVDWNGITDGATPGEGSNTLNNYSTGLIQASESDAVRPGIDGVVNNSGTIKSTSSTDSSSDGIDAQTNTGITITNAAGLGTGGANLIEGARHGITGGAEVNTSLSDYDQPFTMSITNNAGGTIQGDNGSGINLDGVDATEVVTVVNNGTITGDGITRDGDGIDVDGIVNLTNTGKILSINAFEDASEGVTIGGGTIINSGTIEGSSTGTSAYSRGITLAGIDHTTSNNAQGVETDYDIPIQSIYGTTSVTNNSGGLIKGDSESGIAVLGTTGGGFTVTINNNAGGTIEGSNTGVSEDTALTTGNDIGQLSGGSLNQAVIELDDTSNTYVINESGTILQDTTATGTAIAMHGVSNTLNISGGSASITGDISGDTATDSTLNITPGTGNSFSYGYKISNFTVKINSDGTNGTVTLSGANTYSGGTTISGGTTYINNASGSGTGTGAVAVGGTATLGGQGTIQPTGTNAVTVAAGGTLAPGGVQPAAVNDGSTNTANGSLKVDTTNFNPGAGTTPNAIMNITSANLTFALGSGGANSGSQIMVTGGVANTIAFTGDNTVTINDLVDAHLTLNQEYVLIDGDNTTYTGLQFGATSSLGTEITGGLSLLAVGTPGNFFSNWYGASQLYLVGDDIDVEVIPEPSTWGMMLGGLAVLLFIQSRRRRFKA